MPVRAAGLGARTASEEARIWRSLAQFGNPMCDDRIRRKVIASGQEPAPLRSIRRGHKRRKTCAEHLAACRVGRPACGLLVARRFTAGLGVHLRASMHGEIRFPAHARRMDWRHRRHDGDRERGKNGDKTCEHAEKPRTRTGECPPPPVSQVGQTFVIATVRRRDFRLQEASSSRGHPSAAKANPSSAVSRRRPRRCPPENTRTAPA